MKLEIRQEHIDRAIKAPRYPICCNCILAQAALDAGLHDVTAGAHSLSGSLDGKRMVYNLDEAGREIAALYSSEWHTVKPQTIQCTDIYDYATVD